MTAREDRMLVAYVSMTTHCGGNIGPPLLQSISFIKYLKIYFNSILKKGRSYVSSAMGRHWDVCHQHSVFPCCHFTSFEIITARVATVFSLPLLLFHFIWNHNSKGLVSPPLRPIGFVEYIYIYIYIYIYMGNSMHKKQNENGFYISKYQNIRKSIFSIVKKIL